MKLTKKLIKEAIREVLEEGYDAAGNEYVYVILGYSSGESDYIEEIAVTPSYHKANEIKHAMRAHGLDVEVEEAVYET